jgi:phage terminase large subunit-like protein
MHSDISVFDDVVVPDNAYTEEGRQRVLQQYGYLASIEGADSEQWVVGTRYHPRDLYNHMVNIKVEMFDEEGTLLSSEEMYEVFERQVESRGDGTGEFIWPRQQRYDGRWFGFNQEILARKKAQYDNKGHFFALYYNNPHDTSESPIDPSLFQYYDKQYLQQRDGYWTIFGRRLNVVAAVDFAYTYGKRSDSSSIVVVGTDSDNNHYVLDIERFKTDKIKDYFDKILRLHVKWGFRKIRAEVTAAQSVIVRDLKENYIRPLGLALSVDEYKPTSRTGSKVERMAATLYPRYENRQVWHYKDGNCQILEEELTLANPPHDDVKDALTAAIDISVAPTAGRLLQGASRGRDLRTQMVHSRFGGFL